MPYRPQAKFAPGYLGRFLNSPYYHKQLIPLSHGIKVLSVTKAELEKTIISYPTLPEQQKIGDFLTAVPPDRGRGETIGNHEDHQEGAASADVYLTQNRGSYKLAFT